jgi:catechol 2,3-dioxygenase-like lactoylglutathione lyase family enzyme
MLSDARAEATVPTRSLKTAREFFEGPLGLTPAGSHRPDVDVIYECGQGTRLLVYEHALPWTGAHTVAHFTVDDVAATVRQLRGRGVVFEEYDLPELKTQDGVATVGDVHFAWFRDPDANVYGVHD